MGRNAEKRRPGRPAKKAVPTEPARVLLYGADPDSAYGGRVLALLEELSLPVIAVDDTALPLPVGELLERPAGNTPPPYGGSPENALLLMAGLDGRQQSLLLSGLRRRGVPLANKAVLTETNRDWTLAALCEALTQESRTMALYSELLALLKQAEPLPALAGKTAEVKALMELPEVLPETLQRSREELQSAFLTVSGLSPLTGSLTITPTQLRDGHFRLSAAYRGDVPEEMLRFVWDNGKPGPVIGGVPGEALAGMHVTLSSPQHWGSLSAVLRVPERPAVSCAEEPGGILLRWEPYAEKENRPLPTGFSALITEGDGTVRRCEAGAEETSLFLAGARPEQLRFCAVNLAGRSDLVRI